MFESFLFMVLFLCLPAVWLVLLNSSGVRLLTVSIPGFLFVSLLIWQYIGLPILFFYLDDYRAQFITDRSIVWEVFLWTSYTITMMLLGFIAGRKVIGPLHETKNFNIFYNHCTPLRREERLIISLLFFFALTVLLVYVRQVELQNIALFSVLGLMNANADPHLLRSLMTNAFEGKYHWYKLFVHDFLSIASMTLFVQWRLEKKTSSLIVFLASFIIASFSLLMSTEKGPFLWYLISLYICYVIVDQAGLVSISSLGVVITVLLIIIGLMHIHYLGVSNIWTGVKWGFSRVTTGQMVGLYHYLNIFPDQVEYLIGRSFPNPQGILPWQPYALTQEVMNIVHPETFASGIAGSMPTFFWGEMYANFGPFGIIIPPFFVGFFVYVFNSFIFRLPMTPLVVSFFTFWLVYIKNLKGTGLSAYIINIPGLVILIVFLVSVVIAGQGVIRIRQFRYCPIYRLGYKWGDYR